MPLRKVLVANRGEIAVRVIRACRDAGLASVAVYADPDRDALLVRLADEAFALGGDHRGRDLPATSTSCSTSPRAAGADAVHPGYGFLSENADFAQAVHRRRADLDRPDPAGHPRPRRQGHRPAHRHARRRPAGARHRRTRSSGADEVVAFADEHGLPVAIKAAFGGGGRGLKVARDARGDPRAVRVGGPRGGRRRSAAASASSSATSTSPGTSRRRCWPTRTAT